MSDCALRILQTLSLPGHASVPNEDRCGAGAASAFVIDGAGGLGDDILEGSEGSDAAWLAELSRQRFEGADGDEPVSQTVRAINVEAANHYLAAWGNTPFEPWRQPVAGFLLVKASPGGAAVHGLGDCVLFALGAAGETLRHSPMDDLHQLAADAARTAIRGGHPLRPGVPLTAQGTMLTWERAFRARYNTAGGRIWTLGIAPEAADHADAVAIDLRPPFTGLLCTDGFAALADRYHRFSHAGLVEAARDQGLAALAAELRAIETEEDPMGHRYPRMKQSDDATAILFEIT